VEEFAEIVQRLLALALLAYDHIHPQPVERIFVVKIDNRAARSATLRRKIKLRGASAVSCRLRTGGLACGQGRRRYVPVVSLLVGPT